MKKKSSYKWCIFRLDNKTFGNIQVELDKRGYTNVKLYIPTVSILKKRSKGRDIYEDVPLLFNYGFMRMPTEKAFSRYFLKKLQKDIPGIVTWMNSLDSLHPKKKKKRVDGEEFDDYSIVATVSNQEVRRFKRLSKENKVYQVDEITNLKIGDYIVLRGYPFNGVDATIKDVCLTTKMVTLALYPNNGSMEVKLPFDNVVYSIYHNYDEYKLYASNLEHDEDSIISSKVENLIDKKTY